MERSHELQPWSAVPFEHRCTWSARVSLRIFASKLVKDTGLQCPFSFSLSIPSPSGFLSGHSDLLFIKKLGERQATT